MRQEAISKILNGTEPGFIREIEEGLARERKLCSLTESIIRTPRDYLAEGGILKVFLLESFGGVKERLGLFYILAYIYGVYSIKYPEGTPRMEDDDYVLYSKVEEELSQVVPEMMLMLKDTYEAWVVNEVLGYGGHYFARVCGVSYDEAGTLIVFYPYKTGHQAIPDLPLPIRDTYLVWEKDDGDATGIQWKDADWTIKATKLRGKKELIVKGSKTCVNTRITSSSRGWAAKVSGWALHFRWKVAPSKIYVVPKTLRSSFPEQYFIHSGADISRCYVGAYEQLYGAVTWSALFRFEPHIERLAAFSEGVTSLETTKKILKFYQSYLAHPSTNWKQNIATISILLNVAHNNGSMAEDLGSKYTTTKVHGVDEEYLDKLSNLHRYIPQGTDHKTLRGIYNECFYILAELR
jgi:hypothetical protein